MANLRLLKSNPELLTIASLLALLSPEKLDILEQQVRMMRESYRAPFSVRDYQHFQQELLSFYRHYFQAIFGVPLPPPRDDGRSELYEALEFAQNNLQGYNGGLQAAERNSIASREGGMVAVLDAITETLMQERTKSYISGVLLSVLEPSDYQTRFRLAQELLETYGKLLFPNEQLQHYAVIGTNFEIFIQAFAKHLHGIRKQWRH